MLAIFCFRKDCCLFRVDERAVLDAWETGDNIESLEGRPKSALRFLLGVMVGIRCGA